MPVRPPLDPTLLPRWTGLRATVTAPLRSSRPTPRQSNAHQACARCHTEGTVARLEPTRSFCLACHDREADHYAPQECTVCHLQSSQAPG